MIILGPINIWIGFETINAGQSGSIYFAIASFCIGFAFVTSSACISRPDDR